MEFNFFSLIIELGALTGLRLGGKQKIFIFQKCCTQNSEVNSKLPEDLCKSADHTVIVKHFLYTASNNVDAAQTYTSSNPSS